MQLFGVIHILFLSFLGLGGLEVQWRIPVPAAVMVLSPCPFGRGAEWSGRGKCAGRRSTLVLKALLLLLCCVHGAAAAKKREKEKASNEYKWPSSGVGQRTSERISAGKRAAQYIACSVCEIRVRALFPDAGDADTYLQVFESGSAEEALSNVKDLCNMRDLADIFRSRLLEVKTQPDGSASLGKSTDEQPPFYEEINTSDLAFHWQSFAVQHACSEAFRRDGDLVSEVLEKSFNILLETNNPQHAIDRTVTRACRKVKTCQAAKQLGKIASEKSEL